ncbi:iron-sulfur cluster assembly protein IscA [Microbulbifer echini]
MKLATRRNPLRVNLPGPEPNSSEGIVLAITMTEAAQAHIKSQLAKRGKGIGIRVGVKTAGCSGLAYVLEFVDSAEAEDEVFEYGGVQLIVDPKSLVYLDGTQLDFVKEGLNEGFTFSNPNVKNECGCGESFHV